MIAPSNRLYYSTCPLCGAKGLVGVNGGGWAGIHCPDGHGFVLIARRTPTESERLGKDVPSKRGIMYLRQRPRPPVLPLDDLLADDDLDLMTGTAS